MTYEAVMQGIVNYMNKEILSTMTDWQAMLARIAISRVLQSKDGIKALLTQNTFLQTFGVISADGTVDVDGLARDLKEQLTSMGKLEIELPIFGKFGFTAEDVDVLQRYIKEVKG